MSKPIELSCPDWWKSISLDKVKELWCDELNEKLDQFLEQERIDRDPHLYWWPRIDWGRYVEIKNVQKGKKHKGKS